MALTLEQNREIVRRLVRGESIRTVAQAIGCNPSTVQRLKKKLGITPTQMHTLRIGMHTPKGKKHTPKGIGGFNGAGFGKQLYVSDEYQRLKKLS